MDAQVFAVWFMLPVILLVEAVIARELWLGETKHHYSFAAREAVGALTRKRAGVALVVALWALLTLAAWAYEFIVAEVVLYLLLFSLGRLAALLGMLAFLGALVYTPVACWRLIWRLRHRDHEAAATELPRLAS